MPKMCGPETVFAIRQLGYKGLIIGLTGDAWVEDIAHFISQGLDGLLVKPMDYSKLVEMIKNKISNTTEIVGLLPPI